MYQALEAFFMTGTGNSYKVAAWCADAAAYRLLHLAFASRRLRALLARLSPPRYFRRYTAPGGPLADIYKK